jgi:hypothetical protein
VRHNIRRRMRPPASRLRQPEQVQRDVQGVGIAQSLPTRRINKPAQRRLCFGSRLTFFTDDQAEATVNTTIAVCKPGRAITIGLFWGRSPC